MDHLIHNNKSQQTTTKETLSEFRIISGLYELKEFKNASERALRLLESIEHNLKAIQKDYIKAIFNNRLSFFENDKNILKNFSNKELTPSEISTLLDVLIRTEKYSHFLVKEHKRLFPQEYFRFLNFLKNNSKVLKFTGIVLATLFLGLFIWRKFYPNPHGLNATYYSDVYLKTPARISIVPDVDFRWGYGKILPKWQSDFASIRLEGFIEILKEGRYEFQTIADDGVKLSIDKIIIIDDWKKHGPKPRVGTIALKPGYHTIQLEYFEWDRTAQLQLFFRDNPRESFQIIPNKLFFPSRLLLSPEKSVFGTE